MRTPEARIICLCVATVLGFCVPQSRASAQGEAVARPRDPSSTAYVVEREDSGPPPVRAFVALVAGAELPRPDMLGQPVSQAPDGVTVSVMRPEDAAAWINGIAANPHGVRSRTSSALPQSLVYRQVHFGRPALASVGGEVAIGEERTFELNWPDDKPRYYLEPVEADTYRRVQLADRQGYRATLRPARGREGTIVEIGLARMVLTGGVYDESIASVVGKPTLAKTVCTASVPVDADSATVVTWPAPSGTDPLMHLQAALGARARWTAPPVQPLPGLAAVLMAQWAETPGPPIEPPAAAGGPAEPVQPRGPVVVPPVPTNPTLARGLGAGIPIEVACRLIEVPVTSPEWPTILATAEPVEPLEQLMAQGQASVIASPKLLVPDGRTAWVELSLDKTQPAPATDEAPPLRYRVGFTPHLLGDGQINVVVEFACDELLDKVDGAGHAASPVVSRTGAVGLEIPGGGTGVVSGLLRLTRRTDANGEQVREVVETFAVVTAEVVEQATAPAAVGEGAVVPAPVPPAAGGGGVPPTRGTPRQANVLPVPEAPGVRVMYADPKVDPLFIATAADIIAVAKRTMEQTFPGRQLQPGDGADPFRNLLPLTTRRRVARVAVPAVVPPPAGADQDICLFVAPSRVDYHENVATDRRNAIYIRAGRLGIGEVVRPDASPVALLCEAVAELYNPQQLPGFNRFVTHRHLTPAVYGELGVDLLEDHRQVPLASDGQEMLETITGEEYTPIHPDCAAAAALTFLEEAVGLEAFRALLDAIPADAPDALEALRAEAIGQDEALGAAFEAYDEAMRLEPDDEGSCLVTSFEPGETVLLAEYMPSIADTFLFRVATDNQWSLSDAWATDGTHSLCVEADEDAPWMALYFNDPDWRFRDWRHFSELQLDLMVQALEPVSVTVTAQDHPSCGHGALVLFHKVAQPGEWLPVSFLIDEDSLRGRQDMDATYFSGAFRADSVSRLYIGLNRPTQPIQLYVDNIRLTPREQVAEAGVVPGP